MHPESWPSSSPQHHLSQLNDLLLGLPRGASETASPQSISKTGKAAWLLMMPGFPPSAQTMPRATQWSGRSNKYSQVNTVCTST
jgi:hypothetical protein